jgi:excisionase family DNA binding protein
MAKHLVEMQEFNSPYVTLREAADYSRCSPRTIRRWLHVGKLRRHGGGRTVLILREELCRLVRSSTGGNGL